MAETSQGPAGLRPALLPRRSTARAQLDTFSRLQLAAALIECDYEVDGKNAEQSAIFVPFRTGEQLDLDRVYEYNDGHDAYAEQYQQDYPFETATDTNRLSASHDAGTTLEWHAPQHSRGPSASSWNHKSPSLTLDNRASLAIAHPQASGRDINDDTDLASQWGLDGVMSKFEQGIFDPSAEQQEKRKRRKRADTAHTDISEYDTTVIGVPRDGDDHASAWDGQNHDDNGSHASRQKAASMRHSTFSASFHDIDTMMNPNHATNDYDAKFDNNTGLADAQTSSAYAAEQVARPSSSTGAYVSRFDPKAVAALREEQFSSKLRFPNSLNPKILIMPAPLADPAAEEAEEQRYREEEEQALRQALAAMPRPHVDREPGKLYGRSLMDELAERKVRQKAKNRAFQGDSRRAMMDNPVSLANRRRVPSPLGNTGGEGRQYSDTDGENRESGLPDSAQLDSDGKRASGRKGPSANDADPWAKYASRKDVSTAAGHSDGTNNAAAKRVTTLLSPGQVETASQAEGMPSQSNKVSLSTKELQAQYKRASMLSLGLLTISQADVTEDDGEDDDMPLHARQQVLAAAPIPSAVDRTTHDAEEPTVDPNAAVPSVFGHDLVMQRELAKLEKILAVEEAERKIAQAKQRVKDAEQAQKDAKKRAKEEKRMQKKKERDRKKGIVVDDATKVAVQPSHTVPAGADEANTAAVEPDMEYYMKGRHDDRLSLPLQKEAQFADEDDELWNPHRSSMLPLPGDSPTASVLPSLDTGPPILDATPSLTLSLMPMTFDDSEQPPKAARRSRTRLKSRQSKARSWFNDGKAGTSSASASSASSGGGSQDGRRRRGERNGRRSTLDHHADDGEGTGQPSTAETSDSLTLMDFTKQPELKRLSGNDSFAGILQDMGLESKSDDEDVGKIGKRRAKKFALHTADSENEEEESAPLSKVLARRSQMLLPSARVGMHAPQLDFGLGSLSLAHDRDEDSPVNDRTRPLSVVTSESSAATNEEDDTPLAVQKVQGAVAAANAAKGKHLDLAFEGMQVADAETSEDEEDDIPLALRQEDDAPLGQTHPTGSHALAMQYQAERNLETMKQMQAQYEVQHRMHMQMQLQHAALEQAALQGHISASEIGYAAPPSAVSWGGAASDIGMNMQPDPKLVSSVDRWRQNVV